MAARGIRQLEAFKTQQQQQQQKHDETTVGEYRVLKTLGLGTFGRVVLAAGRSGELAAIKLLPRGRYVRSYHMYVLREILHHASLRHPFVIGLNQVILTQQSLAIVMEFAAGGDLLQQLLARGSAWLSEGEVRWLFQQLIVGLAYCHERGVANRDLKLENLLLSCPLSGQEKAWPLLKICDFGYSKHELNSNAKTGVGTPVYMAPEVIAGSTNYDAKKADIWSVGVILYTLLFGKYPFDSCNPNFANHILHGQYPLPANVAVSSEVLELLSLMMCVEPTQRINIPSIFRHPWFLRDLPEGAAAMNDWYIRNAPNLGWCVPVVGQIIQRATEEGTPGEEPVVLKFEP